MSHVYRYLIPIVLFAALIFTACNTGPDLDDPVAVSEHICEKLKEITELSQQEDMDEAELQDFLQEMEDFEDKVRIHHGANYPDFNAKMEAHFMENCQSAAPVAP